MTGTGDVTRTAGVRPDGFGCPAGPVSTLDFAGSWAVLRDHPALTWVPPLWRHDPDGPVYRAIERNLLVEVVNDAAGTSLVRLATGPLRDRVVGDQVDPVAPVAERDGRLDVLAGSFEEAVRALAWRLVDCYGRADGTPPSG